MTKKKETEKKKNTKKTQQNTTQSTQDTHRQMANINVSDMYFHKLPLGIVVSWSLSECMFENILLCVAVKVKALVCNEHI